MVESQGNSGRERSKRDRGRNQVLDESNQETESGPEWGRVCTLINGQVEVYLIGGVPGKTAPIKSFIKVVYNDL